MQVANDVASANELPSCEARPGRRVAAGNLQGGERREDCVKGAGARSRWLRRGQQRRRPPCRGGRRPGLPW